MSPHRNTGDSKKRVRRKRKRWVKRQRKRKSFQGEKTQSLKKTSGVEIAIERTQEIVSRLTDCDGAGKKYAAGP